MKNNWILLDYYSRKKEFFNLGDYTQTLVTKELLDKYFDNNIKYKIALRENLSNVKNKGNIIMQGWFAHGYDFIPSKNLNPIYIGFALSKDKPFNRYKVIDSIQGANNTKIGCRDLDTLNEFKDKGYFSRCLTLLFDKVDRSNINDEILIVCQGNGIKNDAFVDLLPKDIKENSIILNCRNQVDAKSDFNANLLFAKERLERYAKAKLVITNLLHVASPCVAMGIPVVFFNDFNNDIALRRTALAGILPILQSNDIPNIDFSNVPIVNIDKLKELMQKNFELSIEQAFNPNEFKEINNLKTIRNDIHSFISDEYYNFIK